MSATIIACRKCGSEKPPDWTCSHCGGYGMRTGYDGDPVECHACGYSGTVYPPRCPDCSAFRAASTEGADE